MVNLFNWAKKKMCKHAFAMKDLKQTGIAELPTPKGRDYQEWKDYFKIVNSFKHASHTKRVKWPCAKCGKVFYAHCGLDILGTHGNIFKKEEGATYESKTD